MITFDSNCLYIIQCLALVFLAAPCVLFAGGMLICLLLWCGLRITRALNLRLLGLPRCGRCRYWATVQCPLYGRNTPDDFCTAAKGGVIDGHSAFDHRQRCSGRAAGRRLHCRALRRKSHRPPGRGRRAEDLHGSHTWR